ncbi:hypothetical protein CBOM_03403 [Ceraceosorus bombacis]|uniref:Uncharacterized protein n=1 Tax=Ceraceosorus bombacis TaxID=401625 RepID=A0A0P1BMP7_9BASI|nr:hypothetical protein CBOM_03403 [Ceraceosorus bombacis]
MQVAPADKVKRSQGRRHCLPIEEGLDYRSSPSLHADESDRSTYKRKRSDPSAQIETSDQNRASGSNTTPIRPRRGTKELGDAKIQEGAGDLQKRLSSPSLEEYALAASELHQSKRPRSATHTAAHRRSESLDSYVDKYLASTEGSGEVGEDSAPTVPAITTSSSACNDLGTLHSGRIDPNASADTSPLKALIVLLKASWQAKVLTWTSHGPADRRKLALEGALSVAGPHIIREDEQATLNALWDLCDHDDKKIRVIGYMLTSQVSQKFPRFAASSVDILVQCLTVPGCSKEEIAFIHHGIEQHMREWPQSTSKVLLQNIVEKKEWWTHLLGAIETIIQGSWRVHTEAALLNAIRADWMPLSSNDILLRRIAALLAQFEFAQAADEAAQASRTVAVRWFSEILRDALEAHLSSNEVEEGEATETTSSSKECATQVARTSTSTLLRADGKSDGITNVDASSPFEGFLMLIKRQKTGSLWQLLSAMLPADSDAAVLPVDLLDDYALREILRAVARQLVDGRADPMIRGQSQNLQKWVSLAFTRLCPLDLEGRPSGPLSLVVYEALILIMTVTHPVEASASEVLVGTVDARSRLQALYRRSQAELCDDALMYPVSGIVHTGMPSQNPAAFVLAACKEYLKPARPQLEPRQSTRRHENGDARSDDSNCVDNPKTASTNVYSSKRLDRSR